VRGSPAAAAGPTPGIQNYPDWQRNSPLVESKLGHRVPSSRSPSLRPRASPSPGWSYLAPSGGEAPKEPKIAPAMMELSLLVLGSLARSHTSAPRPPLDPASPCRSCICDLGGLLHASSRSHASSNHYTLRGATLRYPMLARAPSCPRQAANIPGCFQPHPDRSRLERDGTHRQDLPPARGGVARARR
jgi:hypothetical protein